MPNPNGKMKMSGDIHLPDVERGSTTLDDFEEQPRADMLRATDDGAPAHQPVRAVPVAPASDLAILGARKIEKPFWKDAAHPVLRAAGWLVGAMLVYRMVRR